MRLYGLINSLYFSLLLLDKYNHFREDLPESERELLPQHFPDPLGVAAETSSIGEYNYCPAVPSQYTHDISVRGQFEEIYQRLYLEIKDHLRFVGTLNVLLAGHETATQKILYRLCSISQQERSDLYLALRNIQNQRDPELLALSLQDLRDTNLDIFADVHQLLFGCRLESSVLSNPTCKTKQPNLTINNNTISKSTNPPHTWEKIDNVIPITGDPHIELTEWYKEGCSYDQILTRMLQRPQMLWF